LWQGNLLGDVGLVARPTDSCYNEVETAIPIAAQVLFLSLLLIATMFLCL